MMISFFRFVSFFIIGVFVFLPLQYTARAATTPNDPLYALQWYLQKINAPQAWDTTTGSHEVIVAVIDSGVDEDHEDIAQNFWVNTKEIPDNKRDDDGNGYVDDYRGWDFALNTESPNPKFQSNEEILQRPLATHHGTVVSGLIGAVGNNGKGIAGVAWNVRIMPLRAVLSTGIGSIYDVVRAIDYAIDNGASIINLSIDVRVKSTLLLSALRRAYAKGVVVVAAAGNDSAGGAGIDLDVDPLYPVCASDNTTRDYVIGVAATDANDQKAVFSHFGNSCVDIAAPGADIISTSVRSPKFGFPLYYSSEWAGTSFATALVSGAAALLRSIHPTLSPSAVRLFLQRGASSLTTIDPVYGNRLGSGRLDIAQSLAVLRSGESAAIIAQANVQQSKEALLAFTAMNGRDTTTLLVTDAHGALLHSWFPYAERYRGNASVIAGDVDGDRHDDILTATGLGGGPHIRLFTARGDVQGQFFAYTPEHRGGVSLAMGDPNPDGRKEFITVPFAGIASEAKIFSMSGVKQLSFFPFTEQWSGGASVASGDVTGDGIDDIVFATLRSARPEIRVTNVFGAEKFSFHPYSEDVGSLDLALADIDGDGVMEIVTARGSGVPEVRVWKNDTLVSNFLAYGKSFRHGVRIAAGDIDGDGRDEIIATPRAQGGAHVRIFSGEGALLRQFFVRSPDWRGGIAAAVVRQ